MNSFHSKYKEIYDSIFIKKKIDVNRKKRKPWITTGIKISGENLKRLDKQRITSSDPEFHVFFRTYKKIYKKILTLAKKKQHNDFIQSAANKTKAAWQIVNSDLGRQKNSKTEISCLVNPQTGENSNISQEIACLLYTSPSPRD